MFLGFLNKSNKKISIGKWTFTHLCRKVFPRICCSQRSQVLGQIMKCSISSLGMTKDFEKFKRPDEILKKPLYDASKAPKSLQNYHYLSPSLTLQDTWQIGNLFVGDTRVQENFLILL